MQPRQIARELALLSVSQMTAALGKPSEQQLQSLMMTAIRTLTTEVHDVLETAAAELNRGRDRLLDSETRAVDVQAAEGMVRTAIETTQTAINRLGTALELPEFLQLSNQQEVRAYALQIISALTQNLANVDALLEASLVDWQLQRLARIDRDILRIAVTEIQYLGIPDRVAINEAVELAKRYSSDEGHRFINGVLRRVTDQLKSQPM